ncbi:LFA3 protein, partial [Indicator maculatus]|nr:LFA3 protein [Indicator maculatus]
VELICCERRFGILGENFTFKEELYQKPFEIIWKKDKNKVAEWEGQDQVTYFWDRGSLNKENGWLTIHHLEKSDAGEYVLEYVDFERRIMQNIFFLLLDPPSEPEISCNITDVINLRCTMDFRLPVNYTWKIGSETQPSHDPEISIPKNYGPSTTVTCSIKPSQTEKSSQISLAQCSQ